MISELLIIKVIFLFFAYSGNATIVTPTSSAVIMATSSATINPTATNVATPTPSTGGDMDGSSCKIYQSVLLVLTLAVISVTIL